MDTSPSDIRKEILAGGSLPGEYSLGPSSGSLVGSPRVTSIVFTPWLTKNELKLALLMPHDYVLFPISFSIVLAVTWNRRSVVCNVILCCKVNLSHPIERMWLGPCLLTLWKIEKSKLDFAQNDRPSGQPCLCTLWKIEKSKIEVWT